MIRKVLIGTSTGKGKFRRVYSHSEQYRQASKDKGKAEVLNNIFASVLLFKHPSNG